MKRTLTSVLFIVLCLFTFGQNPLTVSVPTLTSTAGSTVIIPVKLTGASTSGVPISSANIQITYDPAVLEFVALENFYSGTPQSQWFYSGHDGLVSANWLEPNLLTLAIPDNTTLYDIKFTFLGGNSPLTFVVYEFTDAVYNLIPTTAVHGAVNSIVSRQVTFKVDMSKETVSPSGVHVAGSFNNWNYSQNPMTLNTNGVYSASVDIPENSTVQYRFVNGNTSAGLENVPNTCGVPNGTGGFDRQFVVPVNDTILDTVCFSMCTRCPLSIQMTFSVDMENETISPNGVHVAGTFNNWDYTQTPMTLTTGSIYEATITLDELDFIEFRYANGNTSQTAEIVPEDCSINGNRYFLAPASDTTLTSFCFGSCVVCGGVVNYSNVTFQVDMKAEGASPNGVHIAGTFQGWDPGATPMTHIGDSIYSFTDSLLSGTSVQYKFVNGNSAAGYEIVPLPCSVNGERSLLIPENDTILKIVCFSECDTCVINAISDPVMMSGDLLQNYPNPFQGITHIICQLNQPGYLRLSVFDPKGHLIRNVFEGPKNSGRSTFTFNSDGLPSGMYYYQMIFSGNSGTFIRSNKMIIQ